MKNRLLALATIFAIVIVLLTILLPEVLVSPGKPIAAHEDFASDCFACHSLFTGSNSDKCTECHKVKDIGIKSTQGLSIVREKKNVSFHQKLIEEDCIACHSDHRGVKPFRPISQFSHDLLEPLLQKDCLGCHGKPGDALHQTLKANCDQCHSQDSWLPARFDHSEYFRFDRHHKTECTTCHVNADYNSYTCYGCHEHSRSKIREEHLEEGIRDYEDCSECHRSGDEEEAERLWKSRRNKNDDTDSDSHVREDDDDD